MQLLPECASCTTVAGGVTVDLALSPSVRLTGGASVDCAFSPHPQCIQGGLLAVLTGAGDVFIGAICGRALVRHGFVTTQVIVATYIMHRRFDATAGSQHVFQKNRA